MELAIQRELIDNARNDETFSKNDLHDFASR